MYQWQPAASNKTETGISEFRVKTKIQQRKKNIYLDVLRAVFCFKILTFPSYSQCL